MGNPDGYRVEPGYVMGQMAGSFDLAAGAWQGLSAIIDELEMNQYDLGILGHEADTVAVYNSAKAEMVRNLDSGKRNLDLAGDALYQTRESYAQAEAANVEAFGSISDDG